jgi:hypothetical protein
LKILAIPEDWEGVGEESRQGIAHSQAESNIGIFLAVAKNSPRRNLLKNSNKENFTKWQILDETFIAENHPVILKIPITFKRWDF